MSQAAQTYYDADDRLVAAGEAVLAHYGVPGMRWGHRKSEGSSSGGASARISSAAKATGRAAQTTGRATAKAARVSAPHVKRAAKTAAKVGLRVGIVSALGAIGVPAVVASSSIAMLVAANPEIIKMGSDHMKVWLDDAGIKDMKITDEIVTRARVKTYPPLFGTTTTIDGVVQK